ncbi:MAG: ion channel [Paracoccaceae bacterium]
MVHQIFIGSCLILATIIVASLGFWVAEGGVSRFGPWLVRRPHTPKLALVLIVAVLIVLGVLTVSIWLWALTFLWLGVFAQLEPSVYFSLVVFTTLGYGDVILSPDWRILGGLAAANGLLNMGLNTALLVEILRRVRSQQAAGTTDEG